MYLGDCRAGNTRLLQTTNCLNSTAKESVAYIYSLLQADMKQGSGSVAVSVMYRVFVAGRNVRNWAPLNPAEPHWAVGHLFSANGRELLHLTITPSTRSPSPSSPNAEILSSRDSNSSYRNSSVLDYSHPAQWLVGASRPRLPTQMGVQACDGFHMSHRSRELVLFFFFSKCFSFHLSSLSLFCSLKWPEQGGRAECRRGWKGSNVMPINTFQRKAGIQPQLEVYLSLNDYREVKDCEVKTTTFYCQKRQQEIICTFWSALSVHRGLGIGPMVRFPTITPSPINCHRLETS